jgi:hypothetical protein
LGRGQFLEDRGGGYKKPKIKRGQMGKKGNEEKINNEN